MTYFMKSGTRFNVSTKEAMDLHEYLPAGNYTMAVGSGATRVSKEFVIQH